MKNISSELELSEGLRVRDIQAFACAYDRYAPSAYSIFCRITRSHSVAEDLLQELFLRIWRSIENYDSAKGALGTWILTIARNMGIDYLRSSPVRLAARFRPLVEHASLHCGTGTGRGRSALESADIVRKAFAGLNSNQQKVLELAYFEGCTQSEIASQLGQPLGTVKSSMRAALIRMQVASRHLTSPISSEQTKMRQEKVN